MIRNYRLPALLAAGYFLLIIAWVFSNPPGVAPDEYAHYLRAEGVGRGQLVLDKPAPALQGLFRFKKELVWQQKQARMVTIPARLSPEVFNCRAVPGQVAGCTNKVPATDTPTQFRTWVGTYPPFIYIAPGLVMRVAHTTVEALLIGRIVSALISAALLAAAAAVLWDDRHGFLSIAGLLAAATPMVIFVASTISSSGPEVASGVCFFACLMRLTRMSARPDPISTTKDPTPVEEHDHPGPGWVWWAGGISGVILATSRDLGPVWIALDVLLVAARLGIRQAWALFRASGRRALIGAAAVALAVVVGLAWNLKVQPHPPIGAALDLLDPSFSFIREITRQQIGVFGPLDTVMPGWAYAGWTALTGVLLVLAYLVGSTRQRIILSAAIAISVLVAIGLDALQRSVGFGAQGRHLLPFTVVVPLLAGETVFQERGKIAQLLGRGLACWFAAVAALVHLLGWYTVARRYSVGPTGPLLFLTARPAWTPPLGWPTWTFITLVAISLIAATGLLHRQMQKGAPR